MYTLLIDGNYFLLSRLMSLPKANAKLKDSEQVKVFIRKLATDLCAEVRKLKQASAVNDIVLLVDSKSWRKEYYAESNYKAGRKQSMDIDWQQVYKAYDEFKRLCSLNGIKVKQTPGAEADDLAYVWSSWLNAQAINTIIWSADEDLIQLVSYQPQTHAHTLWYNTTKNLIYAPSEVQTEIEQPADLFNLNEASVFTNGQNPLVTFINTNNTQLIRMDNRFFLLRKILFGDKSDNINPAVYWQHVNAKGKTTNRGLNKNQVNQIKDQLLKELKMAESDFKIEHLYDKQVQTQLADICYRITNKMSPETIYEQLNLNLHLISLTQTSIPNGIIEAMQQDLELNRTVELYNCTHIDNFLANTEYLSANKGKAIDAIDDSEIPN